MVAQAFPLGKPSRADEVVRTIPLPNGASRQRRYDLLGRLLCDEEPDGNQLNYYYDNQYNNGGSLHTIQQRGGTAIHYEMDAEQHQLRARCGPIETAIQFGPNGSPQQSSTSIDGHCWQVEYRWDEEGRIIAIHYPQAKDWLYIDYQNDHSITVTSSDYEYCRAWRDTASRSTILDFANGAWTREELAMSAHLRVNRVTTGAADGHRGTESNFSYAANGRVASVDDSRAEYDSVGHLTTFTGSSTSYIYHYDDEGRLLTRKNGEHQATFSYEVGPQLCRYSDSVGVSIRFSYDAVGRRITREESEGITRYGYNLLGQLERVEMPSGVTIRYLYDGFGRLVGRTEGEVITYYILDLDGRRLAEANAQGQIVITYLWIGGTCVGRIDGNAGEALTHSFHRSYGNRLAAIGDNLGSLQPLGGEDPFGADAPITAGIPAFSGLFGDPVTGLLHAGSRWYDPQVAQFLTPDSWFGDEVGRRMTNPAFRLLDQTPGWTTRPLTPSAAYAWCNGDPLNYSDPSGHNWFGLIFTTLSAFFWEMQLTSVSLQMHVINFIIDTIQVIPVFRPIWDTDGYFRNSVYNIATPVASYRLMVPFALILNGVLNVQDVCWTLGSVIWARGTELRRLEGLSKRELLLCPNAQEYLAVTNVAAAAPRRFHARNPQARASGTVDATGSQVTALAVTAPAGMTPADLLQPGDFVAVKLAAVAIDELRGVTNSAGGTIDLDRPLPAAFQTQAVEVTRLDQPVVKITGANKVIARLVAFVRGKAIHFAAQIPKDYPTDNLDVTEHLTSGEARRRRADFPAEKILLRMAKAADVAGYAANDFVRISGGTSTIARRIERVSGTTDLFLDTAVPVNMERLEVTLMKANGAVVANQKATGDRVTCGPMVGLVPQDGLTLENPTAAVVTVERRIVKQIILDCQVDALLAPLHFIAIKVDIVTPDATKKANGTVTAALEVTTDAGQATRFSQDQPVQITKDGVTHAYSVVESVDGPTNTITLREPLPGADFAVTTVVTVTLLKATNTFTADNVAAPGDHLLVSTPFGSTLAANTIIRVRPAPDLDGGSVRAIKAIPEVIAQVDTALPVSHETFPPAANPLNVQRFVEGAATKRKGVRAPSVRWKLSVLAGAIPYANGDELFIEQGEESVGKVFAINGSDITLQEPIELPFTPPVNVYALTATGKRTANAKLDEGQVIVPSDPKVLLTRREALEHHEMRHVFQGAKWGPFLLSLPIPWLFHLGYSFGELSHSKSSIARHVGLGGFDSLFAAIAWGIGGAEGPTELQGTLSDSARKTVTFAEGTDAAKLGKFTGDSRLEVKKSGGEPFFNVVDRLDLAARQVIMRFEMDSEFFSQNDQLKISVSPFEEMRKKVNTWFSLNLEQLWADHLPQAWLRALSKILNRDSWFPLIGIYPLAWLFAGRDRDRIPLEQDASYHSGDLYSTIILSRKTRIHVGQFARVFAFINARVNTADAAGLAKNTWGNLLEILTVELPVGGTTEDVAGAIPASTPNKIRFRESYYIPLQDRVENAVGALFNPLKPGTYQLKAPGTLSKELVFKFLFDVSFLELSKIEVLDVTLKPDPAQTVFETEEINFVIQGDSTADYRLRFPAGPGPNLGVLNLRHYSVPILAGGAVTAAQDFEIIAAYAANNPVFRGDEQLNAINLTEAQRTNLIKKFTLTIDALPTRNIGPVKAGKSADFEMPIEPVRINVGASPAGAVGTAQVKVLNPGKRPTKLQFRAPATVPVAGDITVDLIYGTNVANRRTITMTVRVEPP